MVHEILRLLDRRTPRLAATSCPRSGINYRKMVEQITVLEFRFGWFPARISWRGREYQIEAVRECKTEPTQHHFWVLCEGVILHLTHLVHSDQWSLRGAKEESYGAGTVMV